MTELSTRHCVACRADAPQVTREEVEEYLPLIPEWELIEVEGVKRLRRGFSFKNFVQSLEFANRVGGIAETEGHHPEIIVEWGRTTVSWWTHKIKGLHVNDFVMAAKTDQLT